jgi:2-polyprenyl-6-methoxyphenol hydroxylase-like FAD-dependent oxidoreductase
MNLGLRDAVSLGDAFAMQDDGGRQKALETYAVERRAAAGKVLELTDRLTRIATLRSPFARLVRNSAIASLGKVTAIRKAAAGRLAGGERS